MSKCLIAGCDLVVESERKVLHGDLHQLVGGGIFVFNGVREPGMDSQAAWQYCDPPYATQSDKQIRIRPGVDYFERRGIITVDARGCWLNEEARKYIGQAEA